MTLTEMFGFGKPTFYTDSDPVVMHYANLNAGKRWWLEVFEAKETPLDYEEDDPLPSDTGLQLPGNEGPTVLIFDRHDCDDPDGRLPGRPIVFTDKIEKAHRLLSVRSPRVGPIRSDGGGARYFEIRDPEDQVIEVCCTA